METTDTSKQTTQAAAAAVQDGAPAATPPAAPTDADFGAAFGAASNTLSERDPAQPGAGMDKPGEPGQSPGEGHGGGAPDAASHAASVYNGRLGKAMRDNNELKRQLAEMREKLAAYERKETDAALMGVEGASALDEESRAGVVSIVRASADALRKEMATMRRDTEDAEAKAEERARMATVQRTQMEAGLAVEAKFPGLVRRVGSGDLRPAWVAFCREEDPITGTTWGESLAAAAARGSVPAASRVFAEFVSARGLAPQFQIGALSPTGASAPAVPRSQPGGADAKVWPSKRAILDEMDAVLAAERRGSIDRKTRVERLAELEDAVRSRRYVSA